MMAAAAIDRSLSLLVPIPTWKVRQATFVDGSSYSPGTWLEALDTCVVSIMGTNSCTCVDGRSTITTSVDPPRRPLTSAYASQRHSGLQGRDRRRPFPAMARAELLRLRAPARGTVGDRLYISIRARTTSVGWPLASRDTRIYAWLAERRLESNGR